MQAITTSATSTHTTISVAGRLDALASPDLWVELNQAFDSKCYSLVIDLSWATFIDSVGLATLSQAMQHARSNDGDVKLVKPADSSAFRVFEITKLDSVFEFVEA